MNQQNLRISDHVKVRFIQRISPGIGFNEASKRINRLVNSPRMQAAQSWLVGSRFKIVANGVVFCVQGECVTTCFPSRRH